MPPKVCNRRIITQDDLLRAPKLLTQLQVAGLQPSTVESYDRLLDAMRRTVPAGTVFTRDHFVIFLDYLSQEGKAPGTAQRFRSAVLFQQRYRRDWLGPNGETWANDEAIINACNGVGRLHKFPPPEPRGAVTGAMLEHAISTLKPTEDESNALRLIYEGGLRASEFAALQAGDLMWDGTAYKCFLRHDKRFRAGGKVKTETHYRLVERAFADAFRKLRKGRRDAELLVPSRRVSLVRLRTIIRDASIHCGWPKGLKWDGIHTLRHGKANDDAVNPLMPLLMDCTAGNVKYYARSNGERLAEKAKESRKRGRE